MFFSNNVALPDGLVHHVYYLSRELKKLGHSVYLYGADNKSLLPLKKFKKIVESIEIRFFNEMVNYWTKKSKKYDNPIKEIESKGVDLIHIHDPYLPFVSFEILEKARLPIVGSFHTAWDENSVFNVINGFLPLFKEVFKNIKGSIAVSKRTKKIFNLLLPKRSHQTVIYNGIDPQFYPKPSHDKNVRLLFVARIIPRKGLMYLLRAMVIVTKQIKNIKLTVMGEGPQLKECRKFVKNHKLTRFVKFKGYVSGPGKIRNYQNADIFCAPYINEAFGVTMIEAMACGVPVVGFKNDATKEIFKDYSGGDFLARTKDVGALATTLVSLIKDDKKRSALGRWCLRESKKYSWSKNAEETEKLYYRVLKKT